MNYGPFPDVYFPSYLFFQSLSRDLEHLRRMFDLLPIGVMAVNNDGIIIYYNRAHSKIDGLTPQEVLGRPESQVFGYPDLSPGIMRACQKMGRPVLGFMCPYYTLKNKERTINGAYWAFPLFDNDNRVMGSVCFTIHLTESNAMVTANKQPLLWPESAPASRVDKKIIGENKLLIKAVDLAKNRADSPSPVLIAGETGTGKEMFARLVHDSSPRRDKAFLAINCAAIPGNLLEGLLFGTVKGSFTGALDKPGIFEEADGGTLYLDEIDSMPLELQPKLLRVLQEMKVTRVGATSEKKLDVKIISSIGTPTQDVLIKEKLRPDLFYRLAVIVISVPPLRERLDDLDDLINYFVAKYNKQLGKKVLGFDRPTRTWFNKYSWPGNVRELEHLIAGSINLADRELTLGRAHLPDHYNYLLEQKEQLEQFPYLPHLKRRGPAAPGDFNPMDQMLSPHVLHYMSGSPKDRPGPPDKKVIFQAEEKQTLIEALTKTRGKLVDTAADLGISRQLLRYKMNKYGLCRQEFLPKLGE